VVGDPAATLAHQGRPTCALRSHRSKTSLSRSHASASSPGTRSRPPGHHHRALRRTARAAYRRMLFGELKWRSSLDLSSFPNGPRRSFADRRSSPEQAIALARPDFVGRITVRGGRIWWAHFEFTRINITPTILRKKFEERRTLAAFFVSPPADRFPTIARSRRRFLWSAPVARGTSDDASFAYQRTASSGSSTTTTSYFSNSGISTLSSSRFHSSPS
jgi:hypothetical protein